METSNILMTVTGDILSSELSDVHGETTQVTVSSCAQKEVLKVDWFETLSNVPSEVWQNLKSFNSSKG